MSFFNSVFQGLKAPVGNNLDNNEDDVLNVKKELGRNGYYDLSQTPEPHGIITKAMDDGIRKYQKDNGLKIDGTLFPGGETETSLFKMPIQIEKKQEQYIPSFGQMAENNIDATGRVIRSNHHTPGFIASSASKTTMPDFTTILKGVDDVELVREVTNLERPIRYLYKDTGGETGYVTIGTGYKVDSVEAAQKLKLMMEDANGNKRPATPEEIARAYKKVQEIPNGPRNNIKADSFKPKEGKTAIKNGLDNLSLDDAENDRLLKDKLKEHAKIVRQKFKSRGVDFDSLPPPAQKVLFDLQYNTGLNLDKSWTELQKAVKARDWAAAADQVHRGVVSKDRNDWAKKQMEKALEWERHRNRR